MKKVIFAICSAIIVMGTLSSCAPWEHSYRDHNNDWHHRHDRY